MTVSTLTEFSLQPTEWLSKDDLYISKDTLEAILNFTARHLAAVPFAVFCVAEAIQSLAKALFFLIATPFRLECGKEAIREYGKSLAYAFAIPVGMVSPRFTMNVLNVLGVHVSKTDKAVATLEFVKNGLENIKTEGTVEELAVQFARFLEIKNEFELVLETVYELEGEALIPSKSAEITAQMEAIRQKFIEKLGRDAGVVPVSRFAPPPPPPAPKVRVIPEGARRGMDAVFAELQSFNKNDLTIAATNENGPLGEFDPAAVRAGFRQTGHKLW